VDRLQKTALDIVTQNQHRVECEVLTDIRQTVEDSSGYSDTETTVQGEVLTHRGHNVEDSIGRCDTEPTDGKL
jgi:hypothetical protein